MPEPTTKLYEKRLGSTTVFLLPSLKLKQPATVGISVEARLHAFLMDNFGGYTAQAGNIFGYWRTDGRADSYGEHREFSVAFADRTKAELLKGFLARLALELREECIYLRVGDEAFLVYPQEEGALDSL